MVWGPLSTESTDTEEEQLRTAQCAKEGSADDRSTKTLSRCVDISVSSKGELDEVGCEQHRLSTNKGLRVSSYFQGRRLGLMSAEPIREEAFSLLWSAAISQGGSSVLGEHLGGVYYRAPRDTWSSR